MKNLFTTYTLEGERTLELKKLNKFQVGVETRTHNGEYFESYSIISMEDAKKIAKEMK